MSRSLCARAAQKKRPGTPLTGRQLKTHHQATCPDSGRVQARMGAVTIKPRVQRCRPARHGVLGTAGALFSCYPSETSATR